ncbi:MAG: ADP-ribosylglycohydrolase family protein [Gudongella sp.]|jgi:ADP-ribosylglycohydrolase|nr:ADP-ribosylglycohydrolase family protein [Gudongella sp.]
MSNKVLDGIMGLVVGDALGVPVEFQSREELKTNPLLDMRSYGTYHQPAGTWSDDSSMTLALLDSLRNGLDYKDIMDKFLSWYEEGAYTPHGEMFDIGIATSQALQRYKAGASSLEAGGRSERDNGNGSLMRILPIIYYLESEFGNDFIHNEEAFDIIHNISALTHGHKRSQMACGIYIAIASFLNSDENIETSIYEGIEGAMEYYKSKDEFKDQIKYFSRLGDKNFKNFKEDEIKSGGYVVDTLEASIWCLLNTSDYKSCVLKAINLGKDTDTTGAVVGGLAGLRYGYETIPKKWIDTIMRKDYIENLCNALHDKLRKTSVNDLLVYIPYFENIDVKEACAWAGGEKVGEKTYMGSYPVYSAEINSFISDFYKSDLLDYEYMTTIRKVIGNPRLVDDYLDTADYDLLKAILTGYIRQERFGDGLWEIAIEEKIFLRILYRFRDLLLS